MHELALCESIRSIVEEESVRRGFQKVKRVRLEIGALSGVEPEAMCFGFDVAMAGSIAEGATLDLVESPGEAWCLPCAMTIPLKERYNACPACGSHQLQVTGGTEMKILELEVL